MRFSLSLAGCYEDHSCKPLYKPSSSFFVRGHVWSTDTCDLEDMILTDEGESFQMHSDTDLCEKEILTKLLRDHQEMLEFG